MDILQAIRDPNLFRPFLGDDLTTWKRWMAVLSCFYGLPIKQRKAREFIKEVTGRKRYTTHKEGGFDTGLFLTGRRSGKSRISSIVGAYELALAGNEDRLDAGEKGMVPILCPTKAQGRIVRGYVESIFESPLLQNEVAKSTSTGIELKNGNRLEIVCGDYKAVRGYTLLCAIVDEVCFFGQDEDFSSRSDTELIRAIKPSLATTGGKLVAISSPYSRKGWAYSTWHRLRNTSDPHTLVIRQPSRVFNPTLPQEIIDQALQEDYASAKAEYLAEWRDDVAVFLPRSVIQKTIVKDRKELLPRPNHHYFAFADVSGGRSDGSALAISHLNDGKVVLDATYHWPAPHDPHRVVACMSEECRRYRVRKVVGDNYAAEFVTRAFQANSLAYERSALSKSLLYLELLPTITSRKVELLDCKLLIDQLANLERRTRAGGKDIVDHPRGAHDDLINAAAGGVHLATARHRLPIGVF